MIVTVISVEDKTIFASSEITVTLSTVGTADLYAQQPDIQIYPNPYSTGILTIELPEKSDGLFCLYDLQGKTVYAERHSDKSELYINPADLKVNPGIYIFKVQNNKGLFIQKLIISK